MYWILDLEGEVHSIWDLWISGLQKCKGNGFFEVKQMSRSFRLGPTNLDFFMGGLPLPESTSPKKFVGVFNVPRILHLDMIFNYVKCFTASQVLI
jgi:hypothetical protein